MKGIETVPSASRMTHRSRRSDHCPAMKGIETRRRQQRRVVGRAGSDHCPAMKGIETVSTEWGADYIVT